MDFEEIRKTAIIAMFSDDSLINILVLKGGNAIKIVLGLSVRTSLDLDFSMEADFEDMKAAGGRIEKALSDRFDSAGYQLFDFMFEPKPTNPREDKPKTWGGYIVEFKLLEKAKFQILETLEDRRRNALVVAPGDKRKFRIEISKFEYCKSKEQVVLDDYVVYVYTPIAIVIEKLRALCQQLPEYHLIGPRLKRPRPRDFYDIYTLVNAKHLDLSSAAHHDLIRSVFSAKDVPLSFLGKLAEQKGFHEQAFDAVKDTVPGEIEPFDVYFKFAIQLVEGLKPLWNV
jgi:predicted nucleotidyltransferase component of viral defense system